jgi:hypothetical protein
MIAAAEAGLLVPTLGPSVWEYAEDDVSHVRDRLVHGSAQFQPRLGVDLGIRVPWLIDVQPKLALKEMSTDRASHFAAKYVASST